MERHKYNQGYSIVLAVLKNKLKEWGEKIKLKYLENTFCSLVIQASLELFGVKHELTFSRS